MIIFRGINLKERLYNIFGYIKKQMGMALCILF